MMGSVQTWRARRGDGGYAIPSVIAGMFLILVLSASVTALVSRDLRDSSRTVGTLEARGAAEAGIDEMFSRLVHDPNYLDTGDVENHPAYANDDPDRLAQISADGIVEPCRFDGTACYQVTISAPQTFATQVDGEDVDYLPGSRAVSIESKAWAKCVRDDTERCFGEARFRGTFRRRTFLEYLILANSEAVDPAALPSNRHKRDGGTIEGEPCSEPHGVRDPDCKVAAYQSDSDQCDDESVCDRILGPIHTNDTRLTICGNPKFDAVEVNFTPSPSTKAWVAPEDVPACASSNPTFAQGRVDGDGRIGPFPGGRIDLPIDTDSDGDGIPDYDYFAVAQQIASDDGVYLTAADLPGGVGPHVISFNGSNIVINGVVQSLPDAGVIYADGPVEVSGGTLDGQLSIVSAATITITGDVLYDNDDLDPSSANMSDDVLGLNAAGNIVIEYPDGAPGESRDRTIYAAMLSVGNSVYVDRWATSDWQHDDSIGLGSPPRLRIVGAIAGNYRGVYGAYDDGLGPTGTEGRLISGYVKDFEYDRRLAATLQPPYFVSPERSAWQRIDMVELTPR